MQDRYFSIELCTQICSQIIEQNSAGAKRGTRSKSSSTIVEELLLRCEQELEVTVRSLLQLKEIDENDPFN